MNKEEILKKSQDENKGKDISDLDIQKKGFFLGFIVCGVIGVVGIILDGYFYKRVPYEILTMFCGFDAGVFIYKYIRLRKSHELLVALIWVLLTICWLTFYILQLGGVVK
ncbi:MAG: DUF6442 family protein [Bacilli bacterium]|jgi:hypothetical protein